MSIARTALAFRLLRGSVVGAGFVLAGCQPAPTPETPQAPGTPAADVASAHAAVRAADSAFAAAAAAHDLDGSVASLTSDAIMFPPDRPPVVGRVAIREYMLESFATPHFSISWTTDTVVVSAGGDMAYSFARSRYTFPARSGTAGAVDTAYAKGVSVWRRESDGRWRTTADIWNGATVLPPIRPVHSPE